MPADIRPVPRPVRLPDIVPESASARPVADIAVTGITLDSRRVHAGDLYAALPGQHTHGAQHAAQAVRSGAVAIVTDAEGARACADLPVPVVVLDGPRRRLAGLASRVYGEPASALQLLAVTGTNGKTTVASMVESGLRVAGRTTGIIGTVGVRVGDTSHAGARTTPEATDLQAILAVMRDAAVETVVMEVSSIAIEESRVDALRYDVAAFTNLSQDHLDYHGSMEEYYRAKARLFTPDRCALGIIGVDDTWGRRLADEAPVPVQRWSLLDGRADWHAQRRADGIALVGPDARAFPVTLPMPGAFNVANAVCAFAILVSAGVPAATAAAGIEATRVPGRMEVVGEWAGVTGIVDYAHSPDAIERVLRAGREGVTGRVIAVLGAGGDRDRAKRPLMGECAARLADVLVITDDNPRSEDPADIRQAVREGTLLVPPGERAEIHEHGDRAAAVTVAVEMAEPGDVILVLGKGHEQGQEAAGVMTPFDDASVLRSALESRATP